MHVEVLLKIVWERPSLALEDVLDAFQRASGVTIPATVDTYLREAGFERLLPPRTGEAGRRAAGAADDATAEPTREAEALRVRRRASWRGDALQYPSSLTDAEWEAVKHTSSCPGRRADHRPTRAG